MNGSDQPSDIEVQAIQLLKYLSGIRPISVYDGYRETSEERNTEVKDEDSRD